MQCRNLAIGLPRITPQQRLRSAHATGFMLTASHDGFQFQSIYRAQSNHMFFLGMIYSVLASIALENVSATFLELLDNEMPED